LIAKYRIVGQRIAALGAVQGDLLKTLSAIEGADSIAGVGFQQRGSGDIGIHGSAVEKQDPSPDKERHTQDDREEKMPAD
jgi:hypothetical protein